ncbi:MAG: 30S ribosomal protein S3ae [Candidatus Micrarchaeia archaeon]
MAKTRVVDKWKAKRWYTVYAPDMFENKKIAEVISSDEANLINRKLTVGLWEITGDMSQMYTTLFFRIISVKGTSAFTKFVGHELSRTYLKTLVRRRRDIIADVIDVKTKDGIELRIKVNLYTAVRVSTPVKHALRAALRKEIIERSADMDFQRLVQEIVFGKFPALLFNSVKKIAPIKRLEIRKTELAEYFKEEEDKRKEKKGKKAEKKEKEDEKKAEEKEAKE